MNQTPEPSSENESDRPAKRPLTKLRSTVRVGLVAIIVIEIALYGLIRHLGWNQTGDVFLLACSCLVIGLPALCVLALLVRNKLRFGTRTLLSFMICVAAFFWITAIPYWQYKNARSATMLLREAKIRVDGRADLRCTMLTRYLDQPWTDPLDDSGISKPVFWIAPFVKELSRIPEDATVQSIWLSSDAECDVFLRHHTRFKGLVEIHLASLSDISLIGLKKVLPQHDKLFQVYCFPSDGKYPSEFWEMVRENRWPILGLSLDPTLFGEPRLPKDMPEWDFLRAVTLYSPLPRKVPPARMHDSDVDTLCGCKHLRYLEMCGMKFGTDTKVEELLPNCKFFSY